MTRFLLPGLNLRFHGHVSRYQLISAANVAIQKYAHDHRFATTSFLGKNRKYLTQVHHNFVLKKKTIYCTKMKTQQSAHVPGDHEKSIGDSGRAPDTSKQTRPRCLGVAIRDLNAAVAMAIAPCLFIFLPAPTTTELPPTARGMYCVCSPTTLLRQGETTAQATPRPLRARASHR
jgi:hypothetical protein